MGCRGIAPTLNASPALVRSGPSAHVDHIGWFGAGAGITHAEPALSANSDRFSKADHRGFRRGGRLGRRTHSTDHLREGLGHHQPPFPRDVSGQRPPGHIAGLQLVTLRVNMCPPWKPISSIRSCGSISIMLQAHPCRGSQQGGKSRAGASAIAMRSRRRPRLSGYVISHNVYYVQSIPGGRWRTVRLNHLAMPSQEASLPSVPLAAWQLRLSPSSDQGLVHDPSDPAADQADPRDNDLFLFKGGSIQSLIGHESQRSQ